MKNLKEGLMTGGNSLTEVKVQRGVFKGDSLSPLPFQIAMMPLNHLLRNCTGEYKLHISQENFNDIIYTDDMKMFAKNERELETLKPAVRI